MRTMKIQFFTLLLLSLLNVGMARGEEAWQVLNLEGRDYLTLDNVADFYQLKNIAPAGGQHVALSDGRIRLETFTNPKELYVNGVKEWLSFPMVFRDGKMLISRFDLAKTIEPCLRPTMIANLEPFQTVVLDAGHGGQDGGGHTATGLEKDYTLDVVQGLKKSLEAKGFPVVLTRSDDEYLSLEQRADLANAIPNAVFVSVHFNSGDTTANGLEIYAMTPRGATSTSDHNIALDQFQQMPGNDFDSASLALANCVHHALLGTMSTEDRGVKRARFAVLRLTHAPAILIEGGFMTNGPESLEIINPVWRQQLAESVVAGLRSYQALVQYKQPPKLVADYRVERTPATNPLALPAMFAMRLPFRQDATAPVNQARPADRVRALKPVAPMVAAPQGR